MAPSAEPQGAHTAVSPPSPNSALPRAPLGPSVTRMGGIPTRSLATRVQKSAPAVNAAFSSTVMDATSAAMSRLMPRSVTLPSRSRLRHSAAFYAVR